MTLVGNDTGGALVPARRHRATPSASGAWCSRPATPTRTSCRPPSAISRRCARVPGGRGRGGPGDADPREPALADRVRLALEAADPGHERAGVVDRAGDPRRRRPPRRPQGPARDLEALHARGRRSACASSSGPTLLAWAPEDRFFKPRSPSASPPTSPARASSGSRTRAPSSPRTSRSGSPELIADFAEAPAEKNFSRWPPFFGRLHLTFRSSGPSCFWRHFQLWKGGS